MGKVNEKKAKRKPKNACEGTFWPHGEEEKISSLEEGGFGLINRSLH
jgi:hypothetical protein